MLIDCSMQAFIADRAHMYDGILFSKQAEKRQPPTVVSLALRFYKSMQEIAHEQGVDLAAATVGKKDTLLDQAYYEYNKHGAVATNESYQLNSHVQRGIKHCILFTSSQALLEIQRLLNRMDEGSSPFNGKTLGSSRWILGGEPPRTRAVIAQQWIEIRTMTYPKQVLFVRTLAMDVQMQRKSGKATSMDLEEWNNIANYACWAGQGVQWMLDDGLLSKDSEEHRRLTHRIVEKDFWEKFTGHWMLQEDDFTKTSYPFWPAQMSEDVLAKDESTAVQKAIEQLNEEEQKTQFTKDTLALTSDQSEALNHCASKTKTKKALRIARAAQSSKSIEEGRHLVVQPFMALHCPVHALEKAVHGDTEYNQFVKKREPADGGERHPSYPIHVIVGKRSCHTLHHAYLHTWESDHAIHCTIHCTMHICLTLHHAPCDHVSLGRAMCMCMHAQAQVSCGVRRRQQVREDER